MIEFSHPLNQSANEKINSIIGHLEFSAFFGLTLDKRLVDVDIFANTSRFTFDGVIVSIESDLFSSFKNLKELVFNYKFLRECILRQGLEWMTGINRDVHVDMNNSTAVQMSYERIVRINFGVFSMAGFRDNPKVDFFYDEDFCVFKDFPFHQLIVFVLGYGKRQLSCTSLWLIRYYSMFGKNAETFTVFPYTNQTLELIKTQAPKCGFKKRLDLCNTSTFHFRSKNTIKRNFEFMVVVQFMLLVAIRLVCLIGIVTNLLVVLTVTRKKGLKEQERLKEKQYAYMLLNSVLNIMILIIPIVGLINECHAPFGIFCSSISKLVGVQYFKIVFAEKISTFFRLVSNFTYMAFALNRMSLVGTPGKALKYFSDIRVKVNSNFWIQLFIF